ncbi:MAG: MerR family transcriptional regulator, partial [Candidatus Cloacimonadaceae bacterium]|nr:MerR family transcriptional regulator [Candidatus Cloacimonadaceae bacterium]
MKYYYTIGEVSNLIGVKPYVIRYWETEFPSLKPRKGQGRIRKYDEDHILLLKKIKNMLYEQRYTIEGARQKLKKDKKSGEQLELELWKDTNEAQESKALATEKS